MRSKSRNQNLKKTEPVFRRIPYKQSSSILLDFLGIEEKEPPGDVQPLVSLPNCSFRNDPVELEDAKIDDDGKAMHEECYIMSVIRKTVASPKSPHA